MAIGRTVHWIGLVFLVVAAVLLLITCIGAPAIHDIGLLKVTLNNASDIRHSSVVFGPFGYCVLDVAPAQTDQDYCSHASVGYIPAQEMRLLDPATMWTTWKGHDLDLMTVAYVLFPIACAIAFIAAAFAFCGVIGSLIASVLCVTAWFCTLAVMVVAFISFGYLKSHVQADGLKAHYGVGMWTCVAAFVLLFFAMLLLLFSCCSGLRRKHRERNYREKGMKHREDSERSLNHPHSNDNHHYGRDAAIAGAGVGAYEAEKHHRNHGTTGRTTGNGHHYDRDAALGGAGAGTYEAEKHHRHHGNTGRSTEAGHHYGRDTALGGAGVGANEAERHHRDHETTGRSPQTDHHYGRDAALGGAGAAGLYEAERHHRNHGTTGRSPETARDRAGQGVAHHGQGNDYDAVLADQDRRNLGHSGKDSHHYGRDAAIGGGALGAAGLGAHDFERSRATPTAVGPAIAAPRENMLRDTMRDSNRGYNESMAPGRSQPYASQGGSYNAPAHHLTTHNVPSGQVTHHHPTTTTTTSTYADERGVYSTGLHTTSHDPMTGATRAYVPGSAI